MNLVKLCEKSREEFEDYCRLRAFGCPYGDLMFCRLMGEYPFYTHSCDRRFSPHLVIDGFWESWMTQCFGRMIQPGWKCVDVGANHGYFTLLMSKLCGETGSVMAFEPIDHIRDVLKENISINGLSNTKLYSCALSDESGEATIKWVDNAPCSGTIRPSPVEAERFCYSNEQSVVVSSLDEALNGKQVDFIKIDAEGFDYKIIKGASEIIARNPKVIINYEHLDPLLQGTGDQSLLNLFDQGFNVWKIDYDAKLISVTAEEVFSDRSRLWNLVIQK